MKLFTICLLLAISVVSLIRGVRAGNNVVCYYGSWAHYRNGVGSVSVQDLDPNLCTHMLYAFLGINDVGDIVILDPYLEIDLKALENFVKLKQINPNVKVMASIGGYNQGGANFSIVAGNAALRAIFVRNVVEFMQKYKFDGFDLDWMYPCDNGGKPGDKENLVLLLKDLQVVFAANNWILSAAVGATKHRLDISYDVINMIQYLDMVHVLTFDLRGSWDGETGHHSALSASYAGESDDLYIQAIIQEWLNAGVDPRKINVGLAFYGRSFRLTNFYDNRIGSPTNGAGDAGPYTQESGALSYLEICLNVKNNNWIIGCDFQGQVPYAVGNNEWVGFDNRRSLQKKVDFAKRANLGGAAVWSLDHDDVHNACGDGKFPLLKAVYDRMNSRSNTPYILDRYDPYC